MRSWHTDEVTIVATVDGTTDAYGEPVLATVEHPVSRCRVLPAVNTSEDGRTILEYDIRMPHGTEVADGDRIRFPLPAGGHALGTVVLPPVHFRSPFGSASATVARVRTVDAA